VHPAISSCCRTLLPDVSPYVVEVSQETARAVTNLLFTGTFARFEDIRFIFTHAGGNVPMLLGRMHQYGPKDTAKIAPNRIEYELKRLYYDMPVRLTGLRSLSSQVSFPLLRSFSAVIIPSWPWLRR